MPGTLGKNQQNFMSQIHWNYFIALEKDLDNLSRYIEFNQSNFCAYSIENAKILMSATQETDVLFKEIYKHHGGTKGQPDITDYFDTMAKNYPKIFGAKVTLISHSIIRTPFANWIKSTPAKKSDSPPWWKANNDVKHNRDTLFSQAALEYVIDSISALLLLNIHYYTLKNKDGRFWPEQDTKLFDLEKNYYGYGGAIHKKCYNLS